MRLFHLFILIVHHPLISSLSPPKRQRDQHPFPTPRQHHHRSFLLPPTIQPSLSLPPPPNAHRRRHLQKHVPPNGSRLHTPRPTAHPQTKRAPNRRNDPIHLSTTSSTQRQNCRGDEVVWVLWWWCCQSVFEGIWDGVGEGFGGCSC